MPGIGPKTEAVILEAMDGATPSYLVKLEQAGWITSEWSESESGRRVKLYTLSRAGRRHLRTAEAEWKQTTGIVERFLRIREEQP